MSYEITINYDKKKKSKQKSLKPDSKDNWQLNKIWKPYLNGHGREYQKVGHVESKGSKKKSQLVLMLRRGSLPRVQVPKGCNRHRATHPHHREVGRKHFALQITKLMPREISKIKYRYKI